MLKLVSAAAAVLAISFLLTSCTGHTSGNPTASSSSIKFGGTTIQANTAEYYPTAEKAVQSWYGSLNNKNYGDACLHMTTTLKSQLSSTYSQVNCDRNVTVWVQHSTTFDDTFKLTRVNIPEAAAEKKGTVSLSSSSLQPNSVQLDGKAPNYRTLPALAFIKNHGWQISGLANTNS